MTARTADKDKNRPDRINGETAQATVASSRRPVGPPPYGAGVTITIPTPVLLAAADGFGLDASRLVAMERGGAPDGAVFPCVAGGRECFLKIKPLAPRTVDAEHDRLQFVEHLRSCGVPVPELLPSRAGGPLKIIEDGEVDFAVTVSLRAPGRHVEIPRDWTEGFIRAWGATMGRMHAAAVHHQIPSRIPTWREEHGFFLAGCRDDALRTVWEGFAPFMATLPTDPQGFGMVHNDLHTGNLILGEDGTLTVLDFDVCSPRWFVSDIATALAHPVWDMRSRHPEGIATFVTTFLDAYGELHSLDPTWLEHLQTFMRYRMTLLLLAMAEERGDAARPPRQEATRRWVLSGEPLPLGWGGHGG